MNLVELPIGRTFSLDRVFAGHVTPQYIRENGALFCGDSVELMKNMQDGTIDIVFADPPYNIKKTEWDNFRSQEEYIDWSMEWISEVSRILKPAGTLYVCGFSEILADLKRPAMKYFKDCRWLIWHYLNKANLGKDWGRSHESILHFRKSKEFVLNLDNIRIPYSSHTLKYPEHPQAETSQYGNGEKVDLNWAPNPLGAKPKDVFEIPTTCNGMGEKTPHPTQKPEELLRLILLASSKKGDIVYDPFSGSGTTAAVSEQLDRKWIASDLNGEYNAWAIDRIDNTVKKTEKEWIEFDKKNKERRRSIR